MLRVFDAGSFRFPGVFNCWGYSILGFFDAWEYSIPGGIQFLGVFDAPAILDIKTSMLKWSLRRIYGVASFERRRGKIF